MHRLDDDVCLQEGVLLVLVCQFVELPEQLLPFVFGEFLLAHLGAEAVDSCHKVKVKSCSHVIHMCSALGLHPTMLSFKRTCPFSPEQMEGFHAFLQRISVN